MTEFTYEDLIKIKSVSHGTFEKLSAFVEILKKWQKTINLISPSTIPNIWHRHIIDSLQLIDYVSPDDKIIDLGSGAGFPPIILSILGSKNITLVESDVRKVAFLKEVSRELTLDTNIICGRVENVALDSFSLITSRGFASLEKTLSLIGDKITSNHKLLLLKGKNYLAEINEIKQKWGFDYKKFQSITDEEGVILLINNIVKTGR